MEIDLNNRETALTNEEFAGLPRNSVGDIIDITLASVFITTQQRARLTGDDWSRMIELDEEMDCLMADARAEFGF